MLIRKLRHVCARRMASTPTKNARCRRLLHHPIGELKRRGDFQGGCTRSIRCGVATSLHGFNGERIRTTDAAGEAANIAAWAASPFGLNLGPDAEPPLERRGENRNVTRKLAEFWQGKNWSNIHLRGELIAVTLNHGSGDAGFPGTAGILIADQLLLTVISITSGFSIRHKRDQRWLRVSEIGA